MTKFTFGYALLAVQKALLGVISPELRAVVVDFSEDGPFLYIRFYYEGKISDELMDLWQCAITEASADLGPDLTLDNEIERVDFPNELTFRGRYAYLRKD